MKLINLYINKRLVRDFPNFSDVIEDIIEPHLMMLAMQRAQHRMPPLLFWGPPGIGKTYFAKALQKLFCTDLLFVDMASQTNGSALCGSSVFWSNAAPGKLFELLAWGTATSKAVANPIVVLDEIDKVQTSDRFDPIAGLYSLLEEETAKSFEDQAVPGVVINVSRVRFILTANDITQIPEPLLSRLAVYEIAAPDALQQRSVLQRIFAGVISSFNAQIEPMLDNGVVDDAVSLSPRAAKVRLEIAVAKTLAAGKNRLDIETWRSTQRKAKKIRLKPGFY